MRFECWSLLNSRTDYRGIRSVFHLKCRNTCLFCSLDQRSCVAYVTSPWHMWPVLDRYSWPLFFNTFLLALLCFSEFLFTFFTLLFLRLLHYTSGQRHCPPLTASLPPTAPLHDRTTSQSTRRRLFTRPDNVTVHLWLLHFLLLLHYMIGQHHSLPEDVCLTAPIPVTASLHEWTSLSALATGPRWPSGWPSVALLSDILSSSFLLNSISTKVTIVQVILHSL